jgi:hypothetical protein
VAEIPNRDELEAAFAKAFGKVARRHMHELRGYLGDPPSVDNVPEEFWQKLEHETEQAVYPHLYSIFLHSANYHGWGDETDNSTKVKALGDFIFKPARALTDAAMAAFGWAKERAKEFASNWVQSRRDGLEKAIEKELRQRQEPEAERPEIIPFPSVEENPPSKPDEPPGISRDRLDEILDDFFGPVAIERNVVDETTQGRHQGAETAIEATVGLGEDDRWRTQKDAAVCPICAPNEGKRREDWPAKFAEGPPCHQRCRCYIDYAGFEPDHVPNVPIVPQTPEDWLDEWMKDAGSREVNKPQIWKPDNGTFDGKKSLKAFDPAEARDDSGKWTAGEHEATSHEAGKHFETGKPVTFDSMRNTVSSQSHVKPKRGEPDRFQQTIEPHGRYLLHDTVGSGKEGKLPTGWESGQVHFNNPLVVKLNSNPDGGIYDETSWKKNLAKRFNATGKKLSEKIAKSGHDGIVTVDERGNTSEIVDIRHLFPSTPKSRVMISYSRDHNADGHKAVDVEIDE